MSGRLGLVLLMVVAPLGPKYLAYSYMEAFRLRKTWVEMTTKVYGCMEVPGPPQKPKIMAQYPKIEALGSIGSIISAILEIQVHTCTILPEFLYFWYIRSCRMSTINSNLSRLSDIHPPPAMCCSALRWSLLYPDHWEDPILD